MSLPPSCGGRHQRREPATTAPGLIVRPGLPLTPRIALVAAQLAPHPDPADRFVAATALTHNATIVSKDERLQAFGPLRTLW